MFYAADNRYGSETSTGFQNTWVVLAFNTKQERDKFVEKSSRQSTRAIKAKEIKKWVDDGEVRHISEGIYFAH